VGLFDRFSLPRRAAAGEPPSDEVLAARYRETGDRALLGTLFTRYTRSLVGVAYGYLKDEEDARDLVMQVFEKLVTDLREHEVQRVKPWLYQVLRNAALMELRRRQRENVRAEAWESEYVAAAERERVESAAEEHLVGEAEPEDRAAAVLAALDGLGAEQRRCLELFYLQRLSYQQVAERTGYPLKAVKSHIQNGKRNLRKRLDAP
jgi:RNA polymerase sigma-70 factor (ECF subfamily)